VLFFALQWLVVTLQGKKFKFWPEISFFETLAAGSVYDVSNEVSNVLCSEVLFYPVNLPVYPLNLINVLCRAFNDCILLPVYCICFKVILC